MKPANPCTLAIDGSPSGIKFAVNPAGEPLKNKLHGKGDRIGMSGTNLTFPAANPRDSRRLDASGHKSAATSPMDRLEEQHGFESIRAMGHRTVHGEAIGENAPPGSARIYGGPGFPCIVLSGSGNAETAGVISTHASRPAVRVMRTHEHLMIARSVRGILETDAGNRKDRP
jgi:acetate kinase